MVWDLFRTKKEKPAAGKTGYWRIVWRRWWDSNPRTLADQTISSRSRYDHFDTSPYLSQHQHLRKRGELMGRTKKNIKFKIPEKPRKIKGFRSGGYRIATTISSSCHAGSFCPSLSLISAIFNELVTALLPLPRKMHGFLKAEGTGGHYFDPQTLKLF